MRGKKFSSPRETNNSDAIAIKNVIQEIAQEEIKKFGFPTYKAAIVRKINEDGTVDCYLPPNEENLVTGILNKCGELLFVGDSVELETKNGSLTNCWVAIKHGTNVQGQAEEVENLSGEVVMKVQNGRLSVTELNRDANLGNAFTIIAEDINLDGMNIVLNGSRGITITSPYFNVTSEGYITATGGKIGGWEMGATRLYSGTGVNYVALDSGTANVNYPIWAGNENPANAPFSVTRGGTIKATNGTIGSFTLNTNRLYSGSGNTTAGIGVYGSDYAFWAGGDTSSSAPYRVSHGGALTATNANITGTITTGNLTATGGNIAGWTINNEAIFNGKGIGESGSLGLSTAFSDWAFWAGNGAFRVTQGGQLNASNVNVTGGSLSIGNRFYVNSYGQFRAYTSGGGYIHMGLDTTNPSVSGLNVGSGGIDCSAAGIRAYRFITEQGGAQYSGKDESIQIYDGHGKVWYLSFRGGILYASEYK